MMIDRWRDVVGCICPATEKLSPLSSRFLVSVHTTDLSPVGSWFLKLSAHTSCILSPVGFQYMHIAYLLYCLSSRFLVSVHSSFILSPVGYWFQYIQRMSYIVTYLLYPLPIRFLVSVQYLVYSLSSRFLVSVRTFRLLLSPVFHLHRFRSRSDNHLTRFQHLENNITTQLTTSVCTTITHNFYVYTIHYSIQLEP